MADALREELMRIPGIAGAEVEGDSGVAGVRVQLTPDADPDRVGAEVRRILANHGMRSAIEAGPDGSPSGPPPPPGVPGSVVSFPRPRREPVSSAVESSATGPTARAEPEPGGLESVAVEEAAHGMVVRIRTRRGDTAEHSIGRSGGLDGGIIAAVSNLRGGEAELVEVLENTVDGAAVMTVVLEVRGSRFAGAAVQTGGRAFAVARAAWAAYGAAEVRGSQG